MSPPAKNKRNRENTGLPARWRYKHGAYYFRVPAGMEPHWDNKKEFRLGSNLADAHRTFGQRMGGYTGPLNTMQHLFQRMLIEHVPTLSPASRPSYRDSIKRLSAVFSNNAIAGIETVHCYQYQDQCIKAHSASIARHDLQVLSVSFSKAIQWGARRVHPIIGTGYRKPSAPPRDRYIEDWEIIECLGLKPLRKSGSVLMVQAYIRIKLLTGLRMTDMLLLNEREHIKDDGIHIQPHKTAKTTGKRRVIEWSEELKQARDHALAARPLDIAPWVFCTCKGEPYIKGDLTVNGFQSIWQRFMRRCLAETKLEKSFTERDLRAKCASDAKTLEHARDLLAHADGHITSRVYRRRPLRVKPLR